MVNNLVGSILRVCNVLNQYSVEYLIVGGTAVALYGYTRHSTNSSGEETEKPDLDFWYNPSYPNYYRLLSALESLGQDVSIFKEEQTPNPRRSFFKFEFSEFTLDILPELKAELKFRQCYENREFISLDNVTIPFIGYDDLILDKLKDPRPKDLEDVKKLTAIRINNNR